MRNYVTPKRSDQLKQVEDTARSALLPCAKRVANETDVGGGIAVGAGTETVTGSGVGTGT